MDKYQNTCIVDTVYALAFYLLISDENEINKTCFFLGDGIPNKIRDRLPHSHYIHSYCKDSTLKHLLEAVWIKIKYYHKLNKTVFWGQDHIWYFPILLNHHKYNLIEDCPMIFHLHEQSGNYKKVLLHKTKRNSQFYLKKFISSFIYGPISGLVLGYNQQCNKIILSKPYVLPYIEKSQIESYNWSELWKDSTIEKRKLIKEIFNLNTIPQTSSHILFTQPFTTDNLLSEEEQFQLYDNICKKYSYEDIVIKPHPRDTFDYKSRFNNIPIIEASIPMQLINLVGIQFKTAITVCSSVVLSFDYDIKIDWIGPSVHPRLLARFGNLKLEDIKK